MFNLVSRWQPERAMMRMRDECTSRLDDFGRTFVAIARARVPIDTGQTHASIGYIIKTDVLHVTCYADTWWAVYVEYGTSRTRAQPFMRPAMAEAAPMLVGPGGGSASIKFPTARR
jgi:HK97 gp10 family phage protein